MGVLKCWEGSQNKEMYNNFLLLIVNVSSKMQFLGRKTGSGPFPPCRVNCSIGKVLQILKRQRKRLSPLIQKPFPPLLSRCLELPVSFAKNAENPNQGSLALYLFGTSNGFEKGLSEVMEGRPMSPAKLNWLLHKSSQGTASPILLLGAFVEHEGREEKMEKRNEAALYLLACVLHWLASCL